MTYETMHQQRCKWYDDLCSNLGELVAMFTYPNYYKDIRFYNKDGVITKVDTANGLDKIKIKMVFTVPNKIPFMTKINIDDLED